MGLGWVEFDWVGLSWLMWHLESILKYAERFLEDRSLV